MSIKQQAQADIKARYESFVLAQARKDANMELFSMGCELAHIEQADYDCIVADYVEKIKAKHKTLGSLALGFALGAWLL
jgi:hypothetical protein